ncbi:PaaI family thioesterase [Geodermatophilus sp. CPCC 205506]|uniref:PaaI family thioesterase n=1 Tax=Geodermatophilus sp. CPCC 205506 TaxID=2936596 RepID=UPI003EEEA8EC
MIDGRLPPAPIGGLMAMTAVSVDEGTVEFRCLPDESAYNPIGVVHGGLVCTLLDSVAGCAVHSTLPSGVGYTSLEIEVSCLRPVRNGGGELTAIGRVTKPGRRAAFADGEVRDGDGRLIATVSSTCLVFPLGDE